MKKETFQLGEDQYQALVALPQRGTGKGVLLFHPWWGLNADIEKFSQMLAEAGFVVMAPDYYQGKIADTIAEAESLRDGMDGMLAQKIALHAADTLLEMPAVEKTGIVTIGFSLGAGFAIYAAQEKSQDVPGVVLFYGIGEGKFDEIRASFLMNMAENDVYEEQEWTDWFKNELEKAGRHFEAVTYPGTEHWFMEPGRPEYQEDASQLAWQRTIEFIRNH